MMEKQVQEHANGNEVSNGNALDDKVRDSVKDYYGKQLKTADDLQTQACVTPGKKVTNAVKHVIDEIHEDVASKYYGCGLVIPAKLEGMNVLDLGSGSGRDCFVISKLVGPKGHVTGLDMTDEQLATARKYIDYHTQKFGYSSPNVDFVKGYIENLTEAGLQENYFDVIVSNCVVNLSPDKRAVLKEAYKVLKEGGEMFFSDIYADCDLSDDIRKNGVLWGEGFGGALHWRKLLSLAEEIGFTKPNMVSTYEIPVDREDFKLLLGDAKFVAVTYRLFKIPKSKITTRSFQVIYNGKIESYEDEWTFDINYTFKKDVTTDVDGGVGSILKNSRFSDSFDFYNEAKELLKNDEKALIEDPFKYIEEKKKQGVLSSPCSSKQCLLNKKV